MPESHTANGRISDVVIPKGTRVFSVDPDWPRQGKPTPRRRLVRTHPFKLSDEKVYFEVGNDLRFCTLADVRFPEQTIAAVAAGLIQ